MPSISNDDQEHAERYKPGGEYCAHCVGRKGSHIKGCIVVQLEKLEEGSSGEVS